MNGYPLVVMTAGSDCPGVVVKSIPENVIAAGNPCRVIRPLDDEVIKKLDNK